MPVSTANSARYAEHFRCIGSACEDTCCQGWSVPVDEAAWNKFQALPQSPLQLLMTSSVVLTESPDIPTPTVFGKLRMTAENQCPLLTEDRLCRIHAALGSQLLPHICDVYPRFISSHHGANETSLALSCPEAARLVLLTPNLLSLDPVSPARNPSLDEPAASLDQAPLNPSVDSSHPRQWFYPIRNTILDLVRNRADPFWQRLFRIGLLCRRLDAIPAPESHFNIEELLADHQAEAANGSMCGSMPASIPISGASRPTDPKAQLDIVLRLAGLMLHKSNIRPRFVACIQAFTAGIGNGPGATLDSLSAHYSFAHDRYFEPFIRKYPHILENYLINSIIRFQFPFGKKHFQNGTPTDFSREFSNLVAQFALMRGLLIGVAGHHKAQFSTDHVIHTVQAASKHFDHHPEFLEMARTLLLESRMDGLRGAAILLRNDSSRNDMPIMDMPSPAVPESIPASAVISAPAPPGGRPV